MLIEITEPKGNAYCRMCHKSGGYGEFKNKNISLRGKKSLKILTHDANGKSISFYCMSCAKEIKKQINSLDLTLKGK
jgi:hypothetical protein